MSRTRSETTSEATSNQPQKLKLEPERYEFTAASLHHFELARRHFFKLLGAGIAVFAIAKNSQTAQETAPSHGFHPQDLPTDISAWLPIGEDRRFPASSGNVQV